MRISDWSSDVCSSDLPASISPQDPQGVFSGGVLVHRVAAPGVLDRPVIPGQFSADAVLNFTTTANPPGCAWAACSPPIGGNAAAGHAVHRHPAGRASA